MMNKRGQINITLLVIGIIVAVILTLGFLFSNTFKLYIIGIAIILVTLIYGFKGDKMNKQKSTVMIIGIILGAGFILVPALGLLQTAYTPSNIPSNVKLAIPHYGAFKCEVAEQKLGQVIYIPKEGGLISKSTVGFYTNGISNIKISFTTSFWSTDWDTRIRYYICDASGNNCGSPMYISKQGIFDAGGTANIPINSVNFATQSLKVYYERLPFFVVGGYQLSTGSKISFDANRYALFYHSTTQNPAGTLVCSTSCDLNCPNIGVRQKLIFTPTNILGFDQSAPSFEYWETISYDLNTQGGATVYDSSLNRFCFSGVFYSATSTKMYDGTTIIYPDVNSKQQKLCCPGALISSTNSDKICNSDGNSWRILQDTDKVTCMSDATCPGAGGTICQNRQLSNGYSCSNKDNNGVGVCVKASGSPVGCCLSSDCNNDMVCDTSSHTCKGGSTLPVCGNRIVEVGETCDDGNTVSGDGCSSTCQTETSPPVIPNGSCPFYQEYIVKGKLSYTWYNYIGIGKPTLIPNPGCYTSGIVYFVVGGIIIAGVLIFLIVYMNKKVKRRKRR